MMWQHFWWGVLDPDASGWRALFFALPRQICTKTSVDGLVACKDYVPCATGAVLATNRVRPGSGTGLPFRRRWQ